MHSSRVMGRLSHMGATAEWPTVAPLLDAPQEGTVEGIGVSPSPHHLAIKPLQLPCDSSAYGSFSPEGIPFSCESPRGRGGSVTSANTTFATQLQQEATFTWDDSCAGNQRGTVAMEPFLADGMPRGRFILLNLLTTWGDMHEVGLNGVEIFDETGKRLIPPPDCVGEQLIQPKRKHREKKEPESNESPPLEGRRTEGGLTTLTCTLPHSRLFVIVEYPTIPGEASATAVVGDARDGEADAAEEVDPRQRVANLVNGIQNTHDDTQLFTMPFTADSHHLIGFILPEAAVISMVRVYNYSGRGRVHANKGVRLLEMTIDDKLVFRGEIAANTGDIVPAQRVGLENCENILFTEDASVLQRLLTTSNTNMPAQGWMPDSQRQSSALAPPKDATCQSTTTVLFSSGNENQAQRIGSENSVVIPAAALVKTSGARQDIRPNATATASSGYAPCCSSSLQGTFSGCPKDVTSVCLLLLGTWGDTEKMGLSGLRFRDAQGDLVSHHITHWYVRFPPQQQSGDGSGDGGSDAWTNSLVYLFDEDVNTALTLPCVSGVEIVFVFETPLPTLSFVEVANYSLGEHTFCGVKEARLFLSSATSGWSPAGLVAAYAALWEPNGTPTRAALAAHGVFEVTPEAGVILRKAPAFLSIPRFQTYDLSLANVAMAAAMSSGGGGSRALLGSLSHSLSASMTIRAEMALRRARMALKPRPEWLLEYQPYITPLLPVAYVLKVSLVLCAKDVEELKEYAKEWMLKPLRACTFADENGQRVRISSANRRNKSDKKYASSNDSSKNGTSEVPSGLVTECLFTPLPNSLQRDAEAAAAAQSGIHVSLVRASVSLVYVADSPFCVSIISLNRPLVVGQRAAWVRHVYVWMDDGLVFDSGDAGVPRHVQHTEPAPSLHQLLGEEQMSPLAAGGAASNAAAPQDSLTYYTRVKPLIFFTLDAAVLEEARCEVMEAAVVHK
ncbi:hypothetical protein DQ04_08361000 [Trypanosoma grayi]|uniref:hypothetical protein n=1 Tax=Trypanosoma grayi TaxID=71804 RepID=UPI0004F43B01|nr:hypothetical protein DQ04_08361000 [Trypanosoma grayi]KEG07964.1 hypothetical protein DQ04_08361000 [Trypanosoma grayi]